MTDRFSGEWTVEIVWGGIWDPALVPGRSRRFVIQGALAGSGAHLMNMVSPPPPPVAVSGPNWLLTMEVYAGGAMGWQPEANQQRRSVAYTLQRGLVVDLTAGNWVLPPAGGGPFLQSPDAASLRCRNVEPRLTPWTQPFANSYDFRMPPQRRPRDPVRPRRPIR